MSPKLPRDVSGERLARILKSKFGYVERNRVGSHIVLQLVDKRLPHITVPAHKAITIGTLGSILNAIQEQTGTSREDLLKLL